jgi:hypothetical protein
LAAEDRPKAMQKPRLDSGVTEYKFKIGHPPQRGWAVAVDAVPGQYQITDGEFQYEIRSGFEDHSRVAKESELTRA